MSPYGGNVWTQRKKFIQRVMNTHTCISARTRKGSLGTDRTRKPQWINTHKYMFIHLVCVKYALSYRHLKPKCYPIASKTCFHFAVILSSVCTSLAVFGTLVFFFNYTVFPHAWYSRSPLQIFIGDDPVERTKRRGQRKWEEGQPFSLYRYQKTKTNQSTWPQFTDGLSAVFVGDNGVRRALPRYYNVSVRVLGFTMSWSRTIPCQRRLCT